MCRVALVVAVKNDNTYLREYVEHHLNLGVNKIILIDNNEHNGELPLDVLSGYEDKIIYIDKRGDHSRTRQWDYYTLNSAMYKA